MNIQGENKDLSFYNKEGVKVYEYHINSDNYWYEYTWDENGEELTYKDSEGFWHEYTYDENGKELTYKDSDGIERGFNIPEYTMKDLVKKLGNFKLIK
jgi:YD repeat-containing protein